MTYPKEPSEEDKIKLEAEHGPMVFLTHPGDGACFGFKAITREQFDVREARAVRGALGADERLLQERCVWPSRDDWNKYTAQAAFETGMFCDAYRYAFGGVKARKAEDFEIPEGANPADCWLTNGTKAFAFRKPGRAEIKLWSAKINGRVPKAKDEPGPSEALLRACAISPDFQAWLDANPFGVSGFGDAFVESFGASEVRVSGKQ